MNNSLKLAKFEVLTTLKDFEGYIFFILPHLPNNLVK